MRGKELYQVDKDSGYYSSQELTMKLSTVLLATWATPSFALCPFAKRAFGDPSLFDGVSKERDVLTENDKRQTIGHPPLITFSEQQEIDVTGVHAWVTPGPNDIHGPCPGLNALANHGYFPHNSVVGLTQAATATQEVYGKLIVASLPHLALFALC